MTKEPEALPGIPGSTETGWTPGEDGISREEWVEQIHAAQKYERSILWVIGDMLIFGEEHLGEDVYQGYEFHYAPKTIERAVKICRAFPMERRRPFVSIWKHERLAPAYIPLEVQEAILDEANDMSEGGLTVQEIDRKVEEAVQSPFGKPENVHGDHCPSCGAESRFWAKAPAELREAPAEAREDNLARLRAV